MKTKTAIPVFKNVAQLSNPGPSSRQLEAENCIPVVQDSDKENIDPAGIQFMHMEFLDEAFLHPEGLAGVEMAKELVTVPKCGTCIKNSRYEIIFEVKL